MKVTNQAELDAALGNARVSTVTIDSPSGVRLVLSGTGDKLVEVTGNSVIERADGNSVIERATGNSVIERATGNSVIKWADGNSVIEWATGNSVIKWADGNSVIKWADGNSVIQALYATVSKATGAVLIRAYEESRIPSVSSNVTVYLYKGAATVDGGHIVDLSDLDLDDAAQWCDYHGVEVVDGHAILYKAVTAELRSAHGFEYPLGETVTAHDWRANNACGNGLHFSPHPMQALSYHNAATRFLKCSILLADLCPINEGGEPKAKARSAEILAETDKFAAELTNVQPS